MTKKPTLPSTSTAVISDQNDGLAKQHDSRMTQGIDKFNTNPSFAMSRQQRRMFAKYLLKEGEQGSEYRLQALRMALEARLQSAEEYFNHNLVTGKAGYRRERNNFFAEQLLELQQKMNHLADQFNANVDARLAQVEKYKSEHLKQREQARLEKSIDDFMDTLDMLMDDYTSIARSKIEHRSI